MIELSLTVLVCRHSSVDSSVPSILPPQVRVLSTTSMLFSIYIVQTVYLSIEFECEKNKNKQKRGRDWPIFTGPGAGWSGSDCSIDVSPFFHRHLDIGQEVVHVVVWQDGRGSVPPNSDEILKVWKHHQSRKSQKETPVLKSKQIKEVIEGGSPGLVVMGGESCSEGHGFERLQHILDGPFSHIFVVIIVMFAWLDQHKWKTSRGWPIFKIKEVIKKKTNILWGSGVAQEVERSLLIPLVRGSYPVIGKIYIWNILLSTLLKRRKKQKEAGNAHLKNFLGR